MRVNIIPIKETGTVYKIVKDSLGEDLIYVRRDSDGESHVCRRIEIEEV